MWDVTDRSGPALSAWVLHALSAYLFKPLSLFLLLCIDISAKTARRISDKKQSKNQKYIYVVPRHAVRRGCPDYFIVIINFRSNGLKLLLIYSRNVDQITLQPQKPDCKTRVMGGGRRARRRKESEE